MPQRCQTCGAAPSPSTQVQALRELGRSRGPAPKIQLCEDCLNRRVTERWDPSTPENARLMEAISEHGPPRGQSYSYVEDPQDAIHLVRLDQEWLHDHQTQT